MTKRKAKSSVKAPAKVVGDPNIDYPKSQNHEGPGRLPASIGHSTNPDKFDRFHFKLRYPHNAPDGEGRLISCSWAEPYAAKAYLDYVIGRNEPTWKAANKLITSTGVEISCEPSENRADENDLERAIDYKPTRAEMSFELPDKDKASVDRLLRPYPDVEKHTIGKAKVERASSKKPDGKYITVGQLCEELHVKPRDARAALRKAKIEKPDHGWAFLAGSAELGHARKIIQRGAK